MVIFCSCNSPQKPVGFTTLNWLTGRVNWLIYPQKGPVLGLNWLISTLNWLMTKEETDHAYILK